MRHLNRSLLRDVTSRQHTANQFAIALLHISILMIVYAYALYVLQLNSESRTIHYHSKSAIFTEVHTRAQ